MKLNLATAQKLGILSCYLAIIAFAVTAIDISLNIIFNIETKGFAENLINFVSSWSFLGALILWFITRKEKLPDEKLTNLRLWCFSLAFLTSAAQNAFAVFGLLH